MFGESNIEQWKKFKLNKDSETIEPSTVTLIDNLVQMDVNLNIQKLVEKKLN